MMIQMELDIASLAKVVGDKRTAESFLEASQARKHAINSVFWNEEEGQWLDYWISDGNNCEVIICTRGFLPDSIMHSSVLLNSPLGYTPSTLKCGKLQIRIIMYLLQTLFLYGSNCSTQVCNSLMSTLILILQKYHIRLKFAPYFRC